MSLCIIKYTYTRYVGVDIEKYTRGLFEYVKEEFGEFQPQMSEPGTIPDMPDYLDIVLCKKDGSIFYEMDIQRRAINIPHDCQMDGLVLEIFIQNCDGTRYKKRHAYPKPWWNHKANGKSGMRKLKFIKLSAKGILTIKKAKTLKASEYLNLDLRFSSFINS